MSKPNEDQVPVTAEEIYALLLELQVTTNENNAILKRFETKVSELEEKLPAISENLAANPLFKPFTKMLGI